MVIENQDWLDGVLRKEVPQNTMVINELFVGSILSSNCVE